MMLEILVSHIYWGGWKIRHRTAETKESPAAIATARVVAQTTH